MHKNCLNSFTSRVFKVAVITALCGLAIGCASMNAPTSDTASSVQAPKLEPLSELMTKAETLAAAEGGKEPARAVYRSAAKLYPTSKQPWLKLGESYFDSGDYGNAILACQEVIERDPSDKVASGLLAVSGLRVSTKALAALRVDDAGLSGDVKSEAKNLVAQLREVVRQSELIPPAAATDKSQEKPRAATVSSAPKARVAVAPVPVPVPALGSSAPTQGPSLNPAASSGKNPTGPIKSSGNPFDKLK
jgi:hypothetical protein